MAKFQILEPQCSHASESKHAVLSVMYFYSGFLLVNLLLLVDAELAGAAVDQEQQTTDNGQNLEEIVLGKVLVGVVLVKLRRETS